MGRKRLDFDFDLDDLPWFTRQRRRSAPRATAVAIGCAVAWVVLVALGLTLAIISAVVHSLGGLAVLAVVLAVFAIYRALKHRGERFWEHELEDDDEEDRDEDREEWRRRWRAGRDREERRGPRPVPITDGWGWSDAPPPPTEPSRESEGASVRGSELALMIMASLGLAGSAGMFLSGQAASSGPLAAMTAVLAGVSGGSLVALLLRRRSARAPEERPTDREVRAQLKRIRGKCARLTREARAAGGVFGDLSWHAPSMARRAQELTDLVLRLRRALRATRRVANPALPGDAAADPSDESLTREYRAAIDAQTRLDRLLAENLRHQRACLAQLERIEDLLDAARLEVASPASAGAQVTSEQTIVADVEAELEASRQALQEMEGIEREETLQG